MARVARVARAGRTGGPEHRVCKGQVRLGKHRGPCGCWRGQERDLVRGQAPSHGLQARCSGKECHAVSVRGLTARCSAGEPLLAPAVLRTRSIPGTPAPPANARSSREHPAGKQRVLQSKPGKSPALPAGARQPAAIPAAAAGFLRCCPRKGSKRGVVLEGTTGKPCEGQLLLAMGQQRGLGWHQMLCREPGYGPAAAAHSARTGSGGEPRTDFRQGEGVMRQGGMGSH